jgi:branched-chain amino acid transport system substrate-binding protein
MHRRPLRAAVGLVAVAALTLAAWGSKAADTTTPANSSAVTSATSTASSPADTSGGSSDTSATDSTDSTDSSESSGSETSGAPSGDLVIEAVEAVGQDGLPAEDTAGGTPVDPAGSGSATCSGVSIAMAGALTGPNAALGQNIIGGVNLALDQHNKANPDCQVEVKQFDTEGDPTKATGVAPSIVSDTSIVGLVGPAFSGETNATMDIFFQANLASLTPSATRVDLTTNGWTNFFRGLPNDGAQGPALANYLTASRGFTKICVVADNSDYGIGLAQILNDTLGDAADASCAGQVKTGDKDFSAAVNTIKSASPDAILYAGYYPEAAPFAKQLKDAGVTAVFVSDDGTNDPQFVAQAGESAEGAILSCPCGPAPEAFASAFEELNGVAPGVYSVEGYDLTTILLAGIDSGITERSAMVDFVASYDAAGQARTYKWDETGELGSSAIWMYEVK